MSRRLSMKRQHYKIQQNSEDWGRLRLGKFTASSFKDLFMGKSTAGYEKAIYTPVHERLTGSSPERFYGEYMKRGHELEPYTIEEYEIETFDKVEDGGFWALGDWIGASPDGLVRDDGLLEGKAPAYNTFMKYLLKGELPKEYYWQVHGQMYVTDRNWVDFVAYHPDYKLTILRINRDEKIENELIEKLNESIEKAQELLTKLEAKLCHAA